jgi:hypothetical protein
VSFCDAQAAGAVGTAERLWPGVGVALAEADAAAEAVGSPDVLEQATANTAARISNGRSRVARPGPFEGTTTTE